MRILVTGASGFLGSHFASVAVSRGHHVVAAVRRTDPRIDGSQRVMDVFDPTPEDISDVDAIVHFAAVTAGAAERFYLLNAHGTLRLFEAARNAGIRRFVHVSSVSVYGSDGRLERRPRYRGAYAGSKAVADELIRLAALDETSPVHTAVLRPGLVYGPGMRASVIAGAGFVAPGRTLLGLEPRSAHLPVVHIEDLSSAIAATIESEVGKQLELWDVLWPTPPTRAEALRLFAELTGDGWKVIWIPSWLVSGVAAVVAAARTLRGAPPGLFYRVRRSATFDSTVLGSPGIWGAVGVRPTGDVRQCLLDGLNTTPSLGETQVVGGAQGLPAELLAAGRHLPPTGEPKPVILVGAGRAVAELHVPVLLRSKRWQVLGVVDQDLPAATKIAARLGAPGARSLQDLDPALVARATLVIATPGWTHAALALEAIKLGADVIVEKPIVTTRQDLKLLNEAAQGKVVSAILNYRLRPNVKKLWRAMQTGNIGPLHRIVIEYHSGRLASEPASWMHHDDMGRTVLTELAIHFLDLACVAVGRIHFPAEAVISSLSSDSGLIRLSALGVSADGTVPVSLAVSVTGAAQRCVLTFEFERASCEVAFFPEGFRVLPVRNTPIDDLGASLSRLTRYALDRISNGRTRHIHESPHSLIYQDHLARTLGAPYGKGSGPFSLSGVSDTMETLFELQDVISSQSKLETRG